MSQKWVEIAATSETEFPALSFEQERIDGISFDNPEEVEWEWALYGHLTEQMSEFVKRRFLGRDANVARLICQAHACRIREKIAAAESEFAYCRELVGQYTQRFQQLTCR
jgi:hypothetical protein